MIDFISSLGSEDDVVLCKENTSLSWYIHN